MRFSGETYAEVTRLLQGYIENEVDMNSEGTCRNDCGYYTLAESHDCFKDQFCAKQLKCKGRIIDCQYIDSDMWVCQSVSIHQLAPLKALHKNTRDVCSNIQLPE